MELVNATGMATGYTMSTDKDGREWLVVVVKGTFLIPKNPNEEPGLAPEQVPLVMTDEFTGEPGSSAPLNEIDFAPRKPRCDVLLTGSAYAPDGRATDRVTVSLRVGSLQKSFDVVGNRVWQAGAFTLGMSKPEPFVKLPITYDRAFGGIDKAKGDPSTFQYYPTNHAGCGWHEYMDTKYLDGTPLPNTEETGNPVKKPNGAYKPMAFGPIGRAWQQRIKWGGTYDKKWLDETAPFLPRDFDERYFQTASEDQQTDYLQGGEEVELLNLTPSGRTTFRLPALRGPFDFHYKTGEEQRIVGIVDMLVLDPDRGRFMLSLRASMPLRRNLHEISLIGVGRVLPQRPAPTGEAQPVRSKPHYTSLRDLPKANRNRRGERI